MPMRLPFLCSYMIHHGDNQLVEQFRVSKLSLVIFDVIVHLCDFNLRLVVKYVFGLTLTNQMKLILKSYLNCCFNSIYS